MSRVLFTDGPSFVISFGFTDEESVAMETAGGSWDASLLGSSDHLTQSVEVSLTQDEQNLSSGTYRFESINNQSDTSICA